MAEHLSTEGFEGESTDRAPEDDFVFHRYVAAEDYTTEEPFDMAPPEGETLFHPYAASEEKAIETSTRSSGGVVEEQFDDRTGTFANEPVEPVDPEVDEFDPQEPAGADDGGTGNDTLIGGRGNDLAVAEDGATADGGGTSTGTDGGSSEPGEPGGGGGDGPTCEEPKLTLDPAGLEVVVAASDEFVFVRWSASEDKAIEDGAASAEENEADYHIILWDIIDGVAPAENDVSAETADPHARGEIVICDEIGGMTLCDVL